MSEPKPPYLDYPTKNPQQKSWLQCEIDAAGPGWVGCCVGAIVGGVILPVSLFFACAVYFDDVGGALVWPILAMAGAVCFAVAGAVAFKIIDFVQRRRKNDDS